MRRASIPLHSLRLPLRPGYFGLRLEEAPHVLLIDYLSFLRKRPQVLNQFIAGDRRNVPELELR